MMPQAKVTWRLLILTVGTIGMLTVFGCEKVEDTPAFDIMGDKFYFDKHEREELYRGLHWYEEPPWTASEAVDQLAHRILVDSPDPYLLPGQLAANFFFLATESGSAERFRETEFGWEVAIPPSDELETGRSIWLISEKGGYRYENKAAAEVAACLYIDTGKNDSGEAVIWNMVDCPIY